ncbi:MAG: RNA methyltransferase [Anaerolineae bacterium]|nr:RNA methyltransferase [Anaerolineae bacterium]
MITSVTNNKVKFVRRLQADRRFRTRESKFVVEGTRWLVDTVQQDLTPLAVFYTAEWKDKPNHTEILHQLDVAVQEVSAEVMAVMSDTETPPGVIAVLPIRPRDLPARPDLLLILDEIRDPGNLGTMLRTAAAAGVDGVLLSPGCVDPYNPKVVRAGMGAQLRLAVQQMDWPEIGAVAQSAQVWLATADGELPYTDVNWRQPAAVLIGSEAHGAGAEAAALATGSVYIPMFATTESLNAATAAGIILFEALRQRRG